MPRELIILDRDGVINEDSSHYIKSALEWEPIPGSLEAIATLNRAGFVIGIATNQSGIGRGLFDEQALYQMHEKLHRLLIPHSGHISYIAYCPHLPEDHCQCRKPQIGMVKAIEENIGLSAEGKYFIGDKYSDLKTAEAANMIPILVLTGKGRETVSKYAQQIEHIEVFDNLSLAAQHIIAKKR